MIADELPDKVVQNVLVEKESAHLVAGTNDLKNLWLRMGSRGLHWQAGPPALLDLRWGFLMRTCQRLTAASVRKHVKAWTSWEGWMASRGATDVFQPDAMTVAEFFDAEAARGATLGRSRMQSFRWLRLRLGIPFPIDDVLLRDFVHFPLSYVAKPAETMTPAMFINLIGLVNRLGVVRAQEPMLVAFLALACVRHKHLAISTVTGHTEEFVFGHCPQGKARRRGTRPPFSWAVPRPPFIPASFAFLLEAAEKMGFPSFVIPARAKTRMMPTRRWLPQPMGHMMTMRVIRQVFEQTGMGKAETGKLTFNTCRRFLPTVAKVFQYTRHEAQAIGNWVEDAGKDGDHAQGSSTAAGLMPMSIHYSGKQALASGMIKQKALHDLCHVFLKVPAAAAILHGNCGHVSESELSWEMVAAIYAGQQKQADTKPKKDKKHKKDKKDKKGQPGVREHHDKGITGKASSPSGPASTQRNRPRPLLPSIPEKIKKQKKDLL